MYQATPQTAEKLMPTEALMTAEDITKLFKKQEKPLTLNASIALLKQVFKNNNDTPDTQKEKEIIPQQNEDGSVDTDKVNALITAIMDDEVMPTNEVQTNGGGNFRTHEGFHEGNPHQDPYDPNDYILD